MKEACSNSHTKLAIMTELDREGKYSVERDIQGMRFAGISSAGKNHRNVCMFIPDIATYHSFKSMFHPISHAFILYFNDRYLRGIKDAAWYLLWSVTCLYVWLLRAELLLAFGEQIHGMGQI